MRGRGGQRGGTSCRTPRCCTTQTFPGLRKTSLRWEKRFGKMQSVMTSVSDVGQAVPIKAQEAHSDTLSLEHIFVSSFVGKQRFFFASNEFEQWKLCNLEIGKLGLYGTGEANLNLDRDCSLGFLSNTTVCQTCDDL